MTALDVTIAVFALVMLARHLPRAVRLLRGHGPRATALVSLVTAILALVILAVAVKGLAVGLISR